MMVQFCGEIFEIICDFLLFLKKVGKIGQNGSEMSEIWMLEMHPISAGQPEGMPRSHPRHRAQDGRCLGLDQAGNPVCGIMPGQAKAWLRRD